MSKAWEKTRAWQMPASGQHKICKFPTPGTDGAGKCQALARGGGGGGGGVGAGGGGGGGGGLGAGLGGAGID